MRLLFTNRISLEFKEEIYRLYAQICGGKESVTAGFFPSFDDHSVATNLLISLRAFLQALREATALPLTVAMCSYRKRYGSCHSHCDARVVLKENAKTQSDDGAGSCLSQATLPPEDGHFRLATPRVRARCEQRENSRQASILMCGLIGQHKPSSASPVISSN